MRSLGNIRSISRSFSTISSSPLRICIVGSGPAGFYTAEKVCKKLRIISAISFILIIDIETLDLFILDIELSL